MCPSLPCPRPCPAVSHSVCIPYCLQHNPFPMHPIPCPVPHASHLTTVSSHVSSHLHPFPPASHPPYTPSPVPPLLYHFLCPILQHPTAPSAPPAIPSCVPCPIPPTFCPSPCPTCVPFSLCPISLTSGENTSMLLVLSWSGNCRGSWKAGRDQGAGAEQGWAWGHPSGTPVGTALLCSRPYHVTGEVPAQGPSCEVREGG